MLFTADYCILFLDDHLIDLSISEGSAFHCPGCSALLRYRDSRPRILKQEGGITTRITVKRFKCPDCRKLHTVLPSCLMPYKHYTTEVICGVLDEVISASDPDYEELPGIETIKRWLSWFYRNLERINDIMSRIFQSDNSSGSSVPSDSSASSDRDSFPSVSIIFRVVFPDWLERLIRIIYNNGGTLLA